MIELVRELALALRERVLPLLGAHAQRAHDGSAAGGDVTFAIDSAAEELLESFLAERAPEVAFYSEDRGLVAASGARTVLVVDPIDGTRPALAGLESCCVSIAAAPLDGGDPAMGDVTIGCVVEIPSGRLFLAERGRGLLEGGPAVLSPTDDLERMFWTYGFRGRPARVLVEVLGDMIDASSVGGATFELGSAAFDMTRIVTGQLDAYVEPGPLVIAEVPSTLDDFRRVGRGAVLNNSPYDLAGAALVLEEAGAIVTDARGDSLADRPLLGSEHAFQMSIVAAANSTLHAAIVGEVAAGIERLRTHRE